MSNNDKLEIYSQTNNSCVRKFNDIFCSWGQRRKPRDINGSLKGMTAPLWKNDNVKFYIIVCIISFILTVLFILSFVIVNYKNNIVINKIDENNISKNCFKKSKEKLREYFIVIGGIILFINAIYYCFMACKKYASDQEWSRYLIVGTIILVIMLLFNIFHYIITVKNNKYYRNDKDNIFNKNYAGSCISFFVANLVINYIVCAAYSILEILAIIRMILLAKNFFFTSYVPHTAKCVDDDIIIIV